MAVWVIVNAQAMTADAIGAGAGSLTRKNDKRNSVTGEAERGKDKQTTTEQQTMWTSEWEMTPTKATDQAEGAARAGGTVAKRAAMVQGAIRLEGRGRWRAGKMDGGDDWQVKRTMGRKKRRVGGRPAQRKRVIVYECQEGAEGVSSRQK